MQLDEPFPLEAIAPRVRRVILDEFQGHWPTVHEIAQISDRHWLATPGVGPARSRPCGGSPIHRDSRMIPIHPG